MHTNSEDADTHTCTLHSCHGCKMFKAAERCRDLPSHEMIINAYCQAAQGLVHKSATWVQDATGARKDQGSNVNVPSAVQQQTASTSSSGSSAAGLPHQRLNGFTGE